MSFLLDFILVFILALCTFIGYKQGLVRALSKFISYLISFALANNFYYLLGLLLVKIPVFQNMLYGEPFAERLTFLDQLDLCFEQIKGNLLVLGDAETMALAKAILDNAVAIMISSFIAFILTFILASLLMKLILFLLNKLIVKLPVLKQVNGVLGGLVGLFNGFFWTWAVTNLFVSFLLPSLAEKWPTVFVSGISESIIVQLCTKINPITYLIYFINFLFH